MKFTFEQAQGYIAAMIDGEGCVECKRYGSKQYMRRRIRITNTSQSILDTCCTALDLLDIPYSVSGRSYSIKPCQEINIHTNGILRLHKLIKLGDTGKQQRLDACAAYQPTQLVRNAKGQYEAVT